MVWLLVVVLVQQWPLHGPSWTEVYTGACNAGRPVRTGRWQAVLRECIEPQAKMNMLLHTLATLTGIHFMHTVIVLLSIVTPET